MDENIVKGILGNYKQQDANVGVRIIEKILFTYMEVREECKRLYLEQKLDEVLKKMNTPFFQKD